MSSDVLYFKVANDSLSSTRFLQEAISAHGVKYLFPGTKSNSLLATDWHNLFMHIFSLIFKQTKTGSKIDIKCNPIVCYSHKNDTPL